MNVTVTKLNNGRYHAAIHLPAKGREQVVIMASGRTPAAAVIRALQATKRG